MKADPQSRARVDDLASRNRQGLLTAEERAEYGEYVQFGTFVAILKSKARRLLANERASPRGQLCRESLISATCRRKQTT